jgi:hypothetical protein
MVPQGVTTWLGALWAAVWLSEVRQGSLQDSSNLL